MKSRMRVLGVILVLALAFALLPAVASAAPVITQGVKGVVRDAVTGVPVPFATVMIEGWVSGTHIAHVTTDYDGTYSYSLAPDDYRISARSSSRDTSVAPAAVTVTAGMVTTQDFMLARSSTFSQPVYRFFNMKGGVHFYTADDAEFINVCMTLKSLYKYDGIAYEVAQGPNVAAAPGDPGYMNLNTVPLYRFFNIETGVHFYTMDEAEMANVKNKLAAFYKYEGVAYKVAKTNVMADGGLNGYAVYRFYNPTRNAHFYSTDRGEIDMKASLSKIYHFEGIGYYTGGWEWVAPLPIEY